MSAPLKKKKRRPLHIRLSDHIVTLWLFSMFVSLLMRLFFLTCRAQHRYHEASLPYIRGEKPAIFCFWHGRLLFMPFITPPRRRIKVLISRSRDGTLISTIMKCFGVGTISGSNSKGATEALLGVLDAAKAGDNIGFTPDGPRGPGQVAAPGATFAAAKTGYPLISVSYAATRHKRFDKSWDRFMLPLPFARVVFTAAEPWQVPASANESELKAATERLQAELNHVTAQADIACGIAP